MANQDWDIEGREVYELFGLKYAEVRTIQTLKDFLKEDGYNLEVIVVDDTGYMNLVLSDKASTRLIRLETVDCIALQIVGTTALFEVIFSSDDGLVRRFNVSRFNDDPDVIEAYKHRYLHEEVVEANVAEEEADDEEQWEHWQEEEEEGSDKSCVDD
ncbi:hypothetical protein CASFOL_013620 [Castilleja foliolosa]|uniref:Uncharacterized protein n=1 Tax=Castilleja foliolosa TaxID=1961234 RepID=A0ABD3DPK0_9LAMI